MTEEEIKRKIESLPKIGAQNNFDRVCYKRMLRRKRAKRFLHPSDYPGAYDLNY